MVTGTLVSVSADGRAEPIATRASVTMTSSRIAMGTSAAACRSTGPVRLADTIAAPMPARLARRRVAEHWRSRSTVLKTVSSYVAIAAAAAASAVVAHGGRNQMVI